MAHKPPGSHWRRLARERGKETPEERERRIAQYSAVPVPSGYVGGIAYGNRMAVLLLHELANDGRLPAAKRRQLMRDTIAVIGQTHARALQEERILAIEARLAARLPSKPSVNRSQ